MHGNLINNKKKRFLKTYDPENLDVVIIIKFQGDYFWIANFCFQDKDNLAEPLK